VIGPAEGKNNIGSTINLQGLLRAKYRHRSDSDQRFEVRKALRDPDGPDAALEAEVVMNIQRSNGELKLYGGSIVADQTLLAIVTKRTKDSFGKTPQPGNEKWDIVDAHGATFGLIDGDRVLVTGLRYTLRTDTVRRRGSERANEPIYQGSITNTQDDLVATWSGVQAEPHYTTRLDIAPRCDYHTLILSTVVHLLSHVKLPEPTAATTSSKAMPKA